MKKEYKNKLVVSIALLFISLSSVEQIENYPLSEYNKQILLSSFNQNIHPHLLSYESFSKLDSNSKTTTLSPILDLRGGSNFKTSLLYSFTTGLKSQIKLQNKWYISLEYALINEFPEKYLSNIQDSLGILLGVGYSKKNKNNTLSHYYSGKINYKASKFFDFEIGRGKNFWGDGYRSLILSNNAAPYPYFKINTNVWKIHYVNLWTQLREKFQNTFQKKYIAFHALSWNISPRFNLSLYESIIWQANDTINNRGIDINYFNPVIFYRSVEHALGSADNVLVGASISYQPYEKSLIYSQLLLDEFLLKEVKARSGWWANKYGLQIGIKTFDILKTGIDFQSEINFVRPFTYSHGSVLQNYGHQFQSLAHPLETNFVEWVNNLHFSHQKWDLNNTFLWAIYGRDEYGQNLGGNIYKSYTNIERIYDNYLAQGNKKTILNNTLDIDRFLNDKKTLRVGLTNLCRYEGNNSENELNIYLLLHVKFNPIPRNINR